MSVLYSSNFKFEDGELRKNQGIMDTNYCNLQQNHHNNSDPTRYRSAPSSFIGNLLNGSVTTMGPGFEDYQSSSPEMETLFMLSSDMHDEKSVKQEEAMYQSLPAAHDADSIECSFGFSGSLGLENSIGNGNSSNLIRQSSSPVDFFSNLTLDNGFNVIRKASTFQGCNGTIDETASTGGKLYDSHISFSSRPSSCSRPMARTAEVDNESGRVSNGNGSCGHFIPNLRTDSWNMLKRGRESTDGDIFCGGLSRSETQNQNFKDRSTALTHHLNLPKTSAEMAVVQKLWRFQGLVPFKTRAKRGCATHPRSIAERVRRTRISERMRKLQALFPNMDKQTNTADMLDMAVEYIKDLQKQVKTLTDTKENCSCSYSKKNKQYYRD